MLQIVKYWVALFKEIVNAYEQIGMEYSYYPFGGNPNEKVQKSSNVNKGQ